MIIVCAAQRIYSVSLSLHVMCSNARLPTLVNAGVWKNNNKAPINLCMRPKHYDVIISIVRRRVLFLIVSVLDSFLLLQSAELSVKPFFNDGLVFLQSVRKHAAPMSQ